MIQTLELLARISRAASPDELWRMSDRAAGFVLRLEMAEVLDAASNKALYVIFDGAAAAHCQEDAQ